MIWWMRSHRAGLQLLLCVGAALAAPLLASTGILLPSLGSTGLFVSAPLAVLVVLMIGLASAWAISRNDTAEWRTSGRDLRILAALQSAGPFLLVAIGAAIWVGLHAAPASRLCVAALGICGLQLIGNALIGSRYQAVIPVLYVFISALFGRFFGHGSIAVWAWPIEADPGRATWAVVAATLALGVGTSVLGMLLGRPLLAARLQARAQLGQ